jgi:hypothetical protein
MNTKRKAVSGGSIQDGSLQNHSITANDNDFVFNYAENTEILQQNLTEHLSQNKKVVRLHRCLGCGKAKTPAKFSIFYGVCKSCLSEVKSKGKLAQSNFIARAVNNLQRSLKGAIHNV